MDIEQIVDEECYNVLQKENPVLLAALTGGIDRGLTAKQIETRLRGKHGYRGKVVLDSAICAAYHYERTQKAV